MPSKISIYAGEAVEAATKNTRNRSGRLDAICERYLALVTDELSRMPLTRDEWLVALDANKTGYGWRSSWASLVANGPSQRGDVDLDALASKMRGFTVAQHAAFTEVCETFWRCRHGRASETQALAQAGIVPVEEAV